MSEIDRLWDKEAIKYDIEKIPVEIMFKENFRQAMLEYGKLQRELSVTKFKEACIELNADEHYHEPLLEMAILTKLEEQRDEQDSVFDDDPEAMFNDGDYNF